MIGNTSPPCMGGWCSLRDRCLHYTAADRLRPIERLCEPGQDGEATLYAWLPEESDCGGTIMETVQ